MGKKRLADGKGTVGRWERNGRQMGKDRFADGKGTATLQINLDSCIPEKELAKTRSQISFM